MRNALLIVALVAVPGCARPVDSPWTCPIAPEARCLVMPDPSRPDFAAQVAAGKVPALGRYGPVTVPIETTVYAGKMDPRTGLISARYVGPAGEFLTAWFERWELKESPASPKP